MDIIKHYKTLKKNDFLNFEISTFEPNPTETDYKNGFIFRYFTRKVNEESGVIYELSKETYDLLNNNLFVNNRPSVERRKRSSIFWRRLQIISSKNRISYSYTNFLKIIIRQFQKN